MAALCLIKPAEGLLGPPGLDQAQGDVRSLHHRDAATLCGVDVGVHIALAVGEHSEHRRPAAALDRVAPIAQLVARFGQLCQRVVDQPPQLGATVRIQRRRHGLHEVELQIAAIALQRGKDPTRQRRRLPSRGRGPEQSEVLDRRFERLDDGLRAAMDPRQHGVGDADEVPHALRRQAGIPLRQGPGDRGAEMVDLLRQLPPLLPVEERA